MPTWICYFINTCFLWQFLKPPPTPLPSTPIVVKLWSIIITRSINLFKSSKMRREPRLLFWIHYQIVKKNFYWLRFKLYFKKKSKTKKTKQKTINKTKKKNNRLPYPVWHLSRQETLSGQVPVRQRGLTSLETAADAHR